MDVLAHCRSEAVRRVDRRAGFVTDFDLRQRDYDEEMWVVLREQLEAAASDIETTVRLLDDAVTTIIDTDLRREWEAERARLRAAYEGRYDAERATSEPPEA